MRAPTSRWGLTGALLLTASLLVQRSSASPSVNVELKASFNSPPYLLELLETAAEENETSYFPLLDRIADGYFSKAKTEKDLYDSFLQLLQHDHHITDAETLSSFQFALSIRSAAPRIEAHYQFYNTYVVPSLGAAYDPECPVWHQIHGLQHCEPGIPYAPDTSNKITVQNLPFDRILGNPPQELQEAPIILYADISAPSFGDIYRSIAHKAKEDSFDYRVRYRPSTVPSDHRLAIAGYGVELALKRTDYIVIDDRDAEKSEEETRKENTVSTDGAPGFNEEDIADLKPLSVTELAQLGLKASSFILSSEDPFSSLIRLAQDFPKHSSAIAAHNITQNFLNELRGNRELQLPGGLNALWINGVQLESRQIDAFTLLEHLRHERKLINALKDLGLSGKDSVKLLSHPAIAESKVNDEPQRYDYRDEIEGGNVIVWMNNIEKDRRYKDWPSNLEALLQRVHPGSLPLARRDIHNLVVPLDFSDPGDVELVVETLQAFVRRQIPVRFGLVPLLNSESSKKQAKIVYHLLDTYGISAVLSYLEIQCLKGGNFPLPDKSTFASTVDDRKIRKGRTALTLKDVLLSGDLDERLSSTERYIQRLGADSKVPPIFLNGVALPRNEEWFGAMSTRISTDHRTIQRGVVENAFKEDAWIPGFFLSQSVVRRNTLIIPEDQSSIQITDMGKSISEHKGVYLSLPRVTVGTESVKEDWAHVVVVDDFDAEGGHQFLHEAIQARKDDSDIELVFLHNPQDSGNSPMLSNVLHRLRYVDYSNSPAELEELLEAAPSPITQGGEPVDSSEFWNSAQMLVRELGFNAGQRGLVVNGRIVGPIPASLNFSKEDLKQLLEYERTQRSKPALVAASALGISDKLDCPLTAATLSSLVALSTVSDIPEGIFETPSTLRTTVFDRWNDTYTTIQTGNLDTAIIQVVAIVDPASELAQRWVPILKALSEISGVHLRLFLNPRDVLEELPVKRFYRYVLAARPTFEEDGSLSRSRARFTGIPGEALLTVGLDVPSSWLVAPKECVYDLDNIKINSLKDRLRGSDVDAIYELEHILIEGHSREVGTGQAPRGAQLVLGTEKNPHYADTIVMANLGYFQFKANPGFWKISLEKGRSQKVFNIDSAGTKGYRPKPGDESTEIELVSFQGKTLFPRLSRKHGRENDDVLGEDKPKSGFAMDYLSKGFKLAENVLSSVGIAKNKEHADINIFSVASGHLYERMLNIMMVSVMKHTKHTVKFWFIEQFLSPSFKDFIPVLAEKYGFSYEMVTYKWPHWLRGQKEKQREIWGYKILFLDVLFPLSLDKVIFVDADQIVRTDMYELVSLDLKGAPYGFTPMCDSRTEMEGFRFWKQGYWKNFLRGLPYHISALYVVDLKRFRQIAAGDRLRQQYHTLSADPNSLSNLDQDLPNHMQGLLPIYSLPQNWLWCETWCSDESLKDAKTIDLCNNPMTKEPKLDRARRQVPEWTEYDNEIAMLGKQRKGRDSGSRVAVEQESPSPISAGQDRPEAVGNTKSRTLEVSEGWKKDEL
ncbi:hypothetical protein GP486_005655 [Trichoglossum hirsutum]|uniref:UDP-glucose:glycoprotein glucosyltransferase n=1 Tax=Trichoglossum hirsutum TaxID=265104 RepID=A0A9P8RM84_9PEZI|nr:hypothetical protein GP486_005655 [Trichoglossum hirsutum]